MAAFRWSVASVAVLVGTVSHAQTMCGEWVAWPTDSPGSVSSILYDVAFTAPLAGLAVGSWNSGLGPQPLVQEWNGAGWSGLGLPDTSGLGTRPQVDGVGLAGGDVWVVGNVTTVYPTNNMPLVMRRHGGGWDRVGTPALRKQNTYPFADRGGFAQDVAGVAPDDVWVVGTAAGYGDGSATSVAMALHFDGSGWVDVAVPIAGNRANALECVSASAPDNVWAVGYWRNIAQAYQGLVVRWDGSAWHVVPNPGEGPAGGDAVAVIAFAPNDVWVSGNFNGGADHLIHWDGSSWEAAGVDLPGPFAAFAATGPTDVWGSCAVNATIYHYDGSSWTPAGGPDIPGSAYVLRGWGLAAIGPCESWSVGAWSDGVVQRTLAERLTPGGCAADFNGDGAVNTLDVLAFLNAFTSGDARADFNGDTVINTLDVLAFLNAFAAGCGG
ncbi:MAG: hypothetical protein KIS87_00120 [Phycisphaeraceae bacterium]|nr:hypothetical protein [Phycisphaeraceae bacterium]